jgi:hypothetical protein
VCEKKNALIYRFEHACDAKIVLELDSHRLVRQCLEHGEDELLR